MGMKSCPNQLGVPNPRQARLREEWRQRLTGPRSDIQLPGRFRANDKNFKGFDLRADVFALAWSVRSD